MPGKPPYFPFYCNDFAADGKVEAMTTEQVGAYILLLCKAWSEDPPGTLPQDETVLARWARLSPERWTEVRAGVLAAFSSGTDNRWHQKRMRDEYAKFSRVIKSKSAGGKKGADKRWNHGIPIGTPNGIPNGKSMAPESESESESSRDGGGGGKGSKVEQQKKHDGPNGQPWSAFLAVEWSFYFSGTASVDRDLVRLGKFFQALLDSGVNPEQMLDRIRDKERRKTEPSWEFEKQWLPPAEKQGPAEKKRPKQHVMTADEMDHGTHTGISFTPNTRTCKKLGCARQECIAERGD